MSSVRTIEMKLIDQLFDHPGNPGYVLDFSNNSFASFFSQELRINIYDDRYAGRGTSKMRRLRCYIEVADDLSVAKALSALWEYRETLDDTFKREVLNGEDRLNQLVSRLGGKAISTATTEPIVPKTAAINPAKLETLRSDLIALSYLQPQARGLAFEKFLRELFTSYGLKGEGSIVIRGEQIDGSFQLNGHTYLVEAKWHNDKTGAADLHVFEGKLGQKATWTRGLFISQSGFTEEGLHAFGRGKRLICMDGLDLWEALNGSLSLPEVIESKATCASKTGEIFVRVRDLV